MISFIRFFSSFLIFLGIISAPVAEYTPLENRAYTDAELTVEPDESKYIKVTVPDTGKNIYQLTEGTDFGYRYGPSLIIMPTEASMLFLLHREDLMNGTGSLIAIHPTAEKAGPTNSRFLHRLPILPISFPAVIPEQSKSANIIISDTHLQSTKTASTTMFLLPVLSDQKVLMKNGTATAGVENLSR